jgi:ribosomal protein L37E
VNDLSNGIQYDKVLQELKREIDALMEEYLQKLHNAFHEDYGLKRSHVNIVNRIKRDCMSIFSDKLGRIAFDDRSEDEIIKEILEYNHDMMDVKHMKEVEGLDLFSYLNQLNEYCLKRNDPGWFQFGIHELLQNGKVIPGRIGSKRTQFCKRCGEQIYLTNKEEVSESSSDFSRNLS